MLSLPSQWKTGKTRQDREGFTLSVGEECHRLKRGSSCRYCGRSDCGCSYQMIVCLLDENHEVLEEFKAEPVTLDPEGDDCSWKQVFKATAMFY